MAKNRETSTDKEYAVPGGGFGDDKKPNWVDLAHLDSPMEDSLANKLIYKPALRFHGLTGGLWGAGVLSDAPSIPSDRPPSYKMVESIKSRGDGYSDIDTIYNNGNISAISPLTLRKRNTMAVIVVAIALLAAVATITGLTLHFLHPKALLRANVRFTIANKNFTDDMANSSSLDFHALEQSLCEEMDNYFMTSELSEFYLGCKLVSMRHDGTNVKNGTAVHFSLDFIENSVSNDGDRIKRIIMRRADRHKTDDTLYLVIKDFLVYLRSLRVDLEVLPLPDVHPGSTNRRKIPWNRDIDFIPSKFGTNIATQRIVLTETKHIVLTSTVTKNAIKIPLDNTNANIQNIVLPRLGKADQNIIQPTLFKLDTTSLLNTNTLLMSKIVNKESIVYRRFHDVNVVPTSIVNVINHKSHSAGSNVISPTQSSTFEKTKAKNLVINILNGNREHDRVVQPSFTEEHTPRVTLQSQYSSTNFKSAFTRRAEPLKQIEETSLKYRHAYPLVQPSYEPLRKEPSVNMIATEDLTQLTNMVDILEVHKPNSFLPKITTVASDMFIIHGTKSVPLDNSLTSSISKMKSINVSNRTDDVRDNNNLKETLYLVNEMIKKPSAQPQAMVLNTDVNSISIKGSVLSLVKRMDPGDVDAITTEPNLMINEIVAPKPKLEPVQNFNQEPFDGTSKLADLWDNTLTHNIDESTLPQETEWINMFNQPKQTYLQYVGDLSNISPNTDTVHANENDLNDLNTFDNSNSESDVVVVVRHKTMPPPLNEDHITWTNTTMSNVAIYDTNTKLTSPFTSANGLRSVFEDFGLPVVPYQNLEPNNHVEVHIEDEINKPIPHYNDNFEHSSSVPFENGPGFDIQTQIIDGQQVLMLIKQESSLSNHEMSRRKDKQILDFLDRVGIDMSLSGGQMNSVANPSVTQNAVRRNENLMDRSTRIRANNVEGNFIPTRHQRILNPVFRSHRIPRHDDPNANNRQQRLNHWLQRRNYVAERMSHYPKMFTSQHREFPISGDFNDIEEMKEVLRHLVNSMQDMTGKLDSMQSAIDFINKTFHETHEPLFNLKGVLNNMTTSLENMNENLRTINQTMKDFKDFLKQFKGTVFNSDNVIKHIDESISNLGKTVMYIENSVSDLNGTAYSISDNILDINSTLEYVNKGVNDVDYTSTYSNETLGSMIETLNSLDEAIDGFNLKFNSVTENVDVFSVALRNINNTVKNTYGKLESLQSKLNRFNSSLKGVTTQVARLNETYGKINKTLERLNESKIVTNGTVLDVIYKLADMDLKLQDLNGNVVVINSNITSMNSSLLDSLKSLVHLVQIVTDFDTRVQENNRSIVVNLKQKDLLDTIRMLLNMNGTLTEIGENVDEINKRIDMVDDKLDQLEKRLSELDTTLDTIDSTFKTLNQTLRSVNNTIGETNKALTSMNTTMASMNATFKGINETLDNINNTLIKVDKTLSKIQTTSKDLNNTLNGASETFNKLNQNIKATNESTNKLGDTIGEIGGPVTDLKLQIHNANESLRIIRSRADIVRNSYRILNDTLSGMDKTVTEITKKLDETSETMAKTNSSLSHVNSSIESMQTSFLSISEELQSLQDSLHTLEDRLQDFGSAFPQINSVIKETKEALTSSKQNIANMNQTLQYSNNARDGLVSRFNTLHENLVDVRKTMQTLEQHLNETKNKSSATKIDVDELETNVVNTEDRYYRTEKNIKYIDSSHENLLNDFKSLEENKTAANESIVGVMEDLNGLNNLLENQRQSLLRYPHIDAGMDNALSTFSDLQTKIEDVKARYKNGSQAFDNVDGLLWDTNGFPVGVHSPFSDLLNSTNFVNKTLKDYAGILDSTASSIKDIYEANANMRKHFDDIDDMKRAVDQIKREEKYLNENIYDSGKDLQKLDTNMTNILHELREKLDDVRLIEKTFGDINGTYNVSVDFDKLESVLVVAIDNIENALGTLKDGIRQSDDTLNLFDKSKTKFSKTVLRRDAEGFDVLNSTLQNLNDTKGSLYVLQDMFSDISEVIENARSDLQDVTNNIDQLEDILTHQKRKNNYVTKYQPIIEEKFNDLFQHYNSSNATYKTFLDYVQLLNEKLSTIREKSGSIQNVNISLVKEEEQIADMEATISTLTDSLMEAKRILDETYNNFTTYDDTNRTFEEVRDEYQSYRKNIRLFEKVLKDMNTSSKDINATKTILMSALEDIDNSLDNFIDLKQPIDGAGHSKDVLNSKLNATNELIIKALGDLQWLNDNFEVIKRNYSNFTETDIDLSDTFLSEAIQAARSNLDNVTSLFSQANITGLDLFETIDQISTNYTEHNYDRTNMNEIIASYLKPTIKHIQDTNETLNKLLDSITISVSKTDMALSGINDTLYATNNQLFKDRQKKLLADTHFPELEEGTSIANKSIATTAEKIQDQLESLQNVMKLYKDLTNRLNKFPAVNISLHNESLQLLEFNQTLQNTSDRILDFLEQLKVINNTLWPTEDERYLQDETIGDIKNRYKTVDEKLNTLLSDINSLNEVLDSAENGTKKINNKLRAINDSLSRYEESESMLNMFLDIFHYPEGYLGDTANLVDKVEGSLSGVKMRVDAIKTDFSGINSIVFETHVNSIDSQINKHITEIKHLKANMSDLAIVLTSAKNDLEVALNKEIASIKSPASLNSSIDENFNIGNDVSDVYNNAMPLINKMNDTVMAVLDSLESLKNNVSGMEDTFIMQEKLEYFEKKFPEHMYKKINETMKDVKAIEANIRNFLENTVMNFNSMNSSLDSSSNLVFDISSLENTLLVSNETLSNTTKTLQKLSVDYEALENLLLAADGGLVSRNETLEEMKNRYETMYTEMNNIQTVLDIVNKTLNNQKIILHDSNGEIDSKISLITDYELVSEDLRKHEDQIQDEQDIVNQYNTKLQNSSDVFENITSVLQKLQTDFDGVSSQDIINLTDSVNNKIASMTRFLTSYKENTNELGSLLDSTDDILSNFTRLIRQDHNDPKILRSIIDAYPSINKTLLDQFATIDTIDSAASQNANKVDENLDILVKDIGSLRKMYEEKEKLDYFENHIQSLRELRQNADKEINTLSSQVRNAKVLQQTLTDLFQKVNNITSEEPSIVIPLSPTQEEINAMNDTLDKLDSFILNLQQSISEIDNNIITGDKFDFITNQTIDDLVRVFNKLNKTLTSLKDNATHVNGSLNSIHLRHGNASSFLGILKDESERLIEIRKNSTAIDDGVAKIEQVIDSVSDELLLLDQDVTNIKESVAETLKKSLLLKNPSLFNRANQINAAVGNLRNDFSKIRSRLNESEDDFYFIRSDYKTMKNVINNSSSTIKELKAKSNEAFTLLNHLSNEINIVNSSLEDVNSLQRYMKSEAKQIVENINDIKKDIAEQEKLEYIQEHAPKIKDLIKNSTEMINVLQKQIIPKIDKSIDKLNSDVTNTLNISVSEPSLQLTFDSYFKKIGDIRQNSSSLTDIINKTKTNILNIDQNMLLEDGSYFGTNKSLADVMQEYEALYNMVAESNENIIGVHTSIAKAVGDIHATNTSINGLRNEIEDFIDMKRELEQHSDKLRKISDNGRQEEADSNELLEQINKLNATLLNTTTMYADVKDDNLERDSIRFMKQMSGLQNKHTVRVTEPLIDNYKNLSDIASQLEMLKKGFQEDTFTLAEVSNKTKTAKDFIKALTDNTKHINRTFETISDHIEDHRTNLTSLNSSIIEFRERLKKQQIYDYIKEHFPTLLEKMKHVNHSLTELDVMLPSVNASLADLENNVEILSERLSNLPNVRIPLDHIYADLATKSKHITNASMKIENLKSNFNSLHDLISNNIGSNETLEDIKTRFKGYESDLLEVVGKLSNVQDSLNNTDASMKNKSFEINANNLSVGKFQRINYIAREMSDRLLDGENTLLDKDNQINNVEEDLKSTFDDYNSLVEKYSTVNSTEIYNDRKVIEDKFKTGNKSMANLFDKILSLKKTNVLINDSLYSEIETLNNIISSFEELETTSDLVNSSLNEIDVLRNNMIDNLNTNMSSDVEAMNNTVSILKDKINELKEKYMEEEKLDFVDLKIKELKDIQNVTRMYLNDTLGRISKTNKDIKTLNHSRIEVQSLIDANPNLKFSTTDLGNELNHLSSITEYQLWNVDDYKETLDLLDISRLPTRNWTELSMKEIKLVFNELFDNLTKLNSSLVATNDEITRIDVTVEDKFTELNNSKAILDRYSNVEDIFSTNEDKLANLSSSLNDTSNLLKDMNQMFDFNVARLDNITFIYPSTTNSNITRTKDMIKEIHRKIDPRLPLASTIFQRRYMDYYDVVNERFDNVANVIYSVYNDEQSLSNVLNNMEDLLTNVTLETKKLADNNKHYYDDSKQWTTLLDNSTQQLDDLETYLKRQVKLDLLNANMPELQNVWKRLNETNGYTRSFLNDINDKRDMLMLSAKSISARIEGIDSLNISIDTITDKLVDIANSSNVLIDNTENLRNSLLNISVFDIDIETIAADPEVSVNNVQGMIQELRGNLDSVDQSHNNVNIKSNYVFENLTLINETLSSLNDSLNRFDEYEGKLKVLNGSVEEIKQVEESIISKLASANVSLNLFQDTLSNLSARYKNYNYDSTDIETVMNLTENILAELRKNFSEGQNVFFDAQTGLQTITNSLESFVSDSQVLNENLQTIDSFYPTTETLLARANETFNDIFSAIPTIVAQLKDIDEQISLMNDTLNNENNKLNFVDNALPILQEKYKQVNKTFMLTNETLEKMAKDIADMKQYVDALKIRMNDFDTVNITMTDIDNNVTYLEDRLIIMQDHYKDVAKIVNDLNEDINRKNIFGRNITLLDIEEQYRGFNGTIDKVSEILQKINQDAQEASEHFDFLNSTARNIDKALDIFEEKSLNIKDMNRDISEIGKHISESRAEIDKIDQVVQNLSRSFIEMQSLYPDVFDYTAENNSHVQQTLDTMNTTITNLKNVMADLEQRFNSTGNDFADMNGTLFEYITTYDDLNNTLQTVRDKYLTLSKAINKLQHGVDELNDGTNATKAVLLQLSSALEHINDTLFKEQEKFDFVQNNMGGLDSKFQTLQGPLDTASSSLNNVSMKVNSTEQIVNDVTNKLKRFGNVKITLDDESQDLRDMNVEIENSKQLYDNFTQAVVALENKVKSLDARYMNMSEITANYNQVDSSLDDLHKNLSNMLNTLELIDFNAEFISNKSVKLDKALDELNQLDTSSNVLNDSLGNLSQEMAETGATINEVKTNTDDLFTNIEQMQQLYKDLDNQELMSNLTDLLALINQTKVDVMDVDTLFDNTLQNHSNINKDLRDVQKSMQGDIFNQSALDAVNEYSKQSLDAMQVDTYILNSSHSVVKSKAFNLMDVVERLTKELYKLNDTMAEEKQKQEYMEENFPHLLERYNTINTVFSATNGSLSEANGTIASVASKLSDVKKRLDSIKAMNIPLDAEGKEMQNIQQKVEDLMKQFTNASDTYERLQMSELHDKNKSFKQVKSTYADYNKTFDDMEKVLSKINSDINDLNISANTLNDSVNDINFTVDEYEESGLKIANIITTGDTLSNSLLTTNESVTKTFSKLQNLNDSLEAMLKNFSHIEDQEIKQAQDLIKSLFLASKEKVDNLKQTIGNLHDANKDSQGLISNMNDTHKETKTALDQLKQHLQKINDTGNVVKANIQNIETQRLGISNDTDKLNPELDKLMDKINDLAKAFLTEQEKIDLISSNVPTLTNRLKDLNEPFAGTLSRISLNQVQLADLKYEIKTTGTRLGKFKTINITTDIEMREWENMNSTVDTQEKSFNSLRNQYQSLQNTIKTLNDRSISKAEIDEKIKSMNATLDSIESGLALINTSMKDVEDKSVTMGNGLNELSKSMDNFKTLQEQTSKTGIQMKTTSDKIKNLTNKSGEISMDITTLDKQIKSMTKLYAPLNDKTWNSVKGKIQQGLTSLSTNVGKVNTTLDGLVERSTTTENKLDNVASTVKTSILTRDTLDPTVQSLLNDVKQLGTQLTQLQSPIDNQNKQLDTLQTSVNKAKAAITRQNATLHKELLKYNYVKENLPSLRTKHTEANQSFTANIPDMNDMKGSITNLVSIITKIKEKMMLFGLDDTDQSLKKWDDTISKLNNTVIMIEKKNKETLDTLDNLKKTLWSNEDMYTRKETVDSVETRFRNINKTLDDIKAASHTIKVSLNDVSTRAAGVISQLMERDSILTTTPATTTPSGPPEWLVINSTVEGQIGKDSAFVECSAAELTEWSVLWITRVNRDGVEEKIAGWKQGTGARKMIQDRRIKARRILEGIGGKLSVTIDQLQCEDEGTYYCYIDSYDMWPLETYIGVTSPPEDNVTPDFPTEVFEDKITNFSCTGRPGYPGGQMTWMVKHQNEATFRPVDFYSSKRKVSDAGCVRTETNIVEYQFNMTWNNTKVRCYIENTDYFAEGKIQLLPYDICNKVRYLGTISHPYTPHKYIVCGKQLNIMQCPGDTCYDVQEENCRECKAGQGADGDPCRGKPHFTYVAHEYDCKRYYLCLGQTKTLRKCSKGYFNPDKAGNCGLSYAQSLCGQKDGSAGR